jgi:HSP20 family molecular chaperone IbpA
MGRQSAVSKQMRKAKNAKLVVPPDDFYKHRQSIYDPIARRAYERFESRGSVHGHHEDDWYQAESELLQPVTFELSDSGDAFIVVSNVTGYRPEDLRVSVELRSLRICGQALAENKRSGKSQEELRRFEGFFLSFDLPASIDTSQASAEIISHNILEVRLPKMRPPEA